MSHITRCLLLAGTIIMTLSTAAETHIVEMRNADPNDPTRANLFLPALLRIENGDRVIFKAIDKGHNSAAKRGMLPDGAASWNGAMNKDIEVTFTVDGTYGYICLPHYQMGMVGLILVGDFRSNIEQARSVRHRGRAVKAFKALFNQVEADGSR